MQCRSLLLTTEVLCIQSVNQDGAAFRTNSVAELGLRSMIGCRCRGKDLADYLSRERLVNEHLLCNWTHSHGPES